jgi:hypothetical protein
MPGYDIGAATLVFMLAVNFAVFLLRRGLRGRGAAMIRRQLPAGEIGAYAAAVAVWVVGFALPYVWPESPWARALAQPWAFPCLVAWSMLVGVVLLVLMRMMRARRSAGGG